MYRSDKRSNPVHEFKIQQKREDGFSRAMHEYARPILAFYCFGLRARTSMAKETRTHLVDGLRWGDQLLPGFLGHRRVNAK